MNKLHVKYSEAHRLRKLLQSDTQKLNARDVRSLIKILNDIYPPRKHTPKYAAWELLLLGFGLGLLVILILAF